MTSPVITIRKSENLTNAADEMRLADVRHLAVVDAKGRVVGMLSNRDLDRARGRPDATTAQVADVMTDEVLTVKPESHACEASAILLDHKIGALPVVDDAGLPVGIISETDFLRVAHVSLGGDRLSDDDD